MQGVAYKCTLNYMRFVNQRIEVCRCEREAYNQFEHLHYLKGGICKGASCYLFKINGKIGAFASLLAMPFKGHCNAFIFHRIVVLEPFQGLGLSTLVVNLLGGAFKSEGKDVYLKSDSKRMGKMLGSNSQWQATAMNKRSRKLTKQDNKRNKARHRRGAFSFKYIGMGIDGYDSIVRHIEEIREEHLMGKWLPVDVLLLAKISFRLDNPVFLKDTLSMDFNALTTKYKSVYCCNNPHEDKLYTTEYVIRRTKQDTSKEYAKRLLFLNGMIRMNQHIYTIETLIYCLLEENYTQNFKLDSYEVVKVALNVYKTDKLRYDNLINAINSQTSYKVNAEVAKNKGLTLKQASNIARKQIRAEQIAKMYNPTLTDEENIRYFASNGLNISLSTLKRWRKENNYTKYRKSVIPTI